MASFMGIPEAVTAISAGLLESRSIYAAGMEYVRGGDKFKRLERPIGLGDLSHGVVYNSLATIAGLEELPDTVNLNRAYLIAPNGNMNEVLSNYVIHRFGLPHEWETEYPFIFDHMMTPLEVVRNEHFSEQWPNLQAAVFRGTEELVLQAIKGALINGMLRIPQSEIVGVFDEAMSMKEYMLQNADIMAQKLQSHKPRHSLDMPLHESIGQMKRIPFPAQAHMIQALYNTMRFENGLFLSGDMGTGKSIVACGVANIIEQQRKAGNRSTSGTAVLLSAPGITLRKWKNKEIMGTLQDVKVNIIENSKDALQLMRRVKEGYQPQGLEFTLVGIDKAKIGAEPYFSGVWKRVSDSISQYAWHCPDCGRPLMVKDEEEEEGYVPAAWHYFAEGVEPDQEDYLKARTEQSFRPNGVPNHIRLKWRRNRRLLTCTYHEKGHLPDAQTSCKEKLWRPAVWSRGETRNRPRTNIARVLKRMGRYFDLYICDEAHQCKAESSGRGDAFAQMVKASKKTLMLTGTLTNGKSSSIKELLWRTDPRSLLEVGIDYTFGSIQWAARYGKLKQIVDVEEKDTGWVTKKKQKPRQPTEEPGIAPQLTAQFLLHKSGFVELSDMGLPLVELKEVPLFIDMDDEHALCYRSFHSRLEEECKLRSLSGAKGAWSKFIPATINYGDRPDRGGSVTFGFADKAFKIEAKAFPDDYLHAKERELLRLVEKELAEGRRCVIFNNYTGEYNLNERIRDILIRKGFNCQILDEPSTDNRSEVIAQLEEQEVPIIICNMKLVEVGLDLMYWPTIIYYQLNYEVSTVRQSSRRAWRLGQDRECRVFYLIYNGTQQMAQFLRIMAARGHALMVEGRLDKSELAIYARDQQSSLAADLANCFAGSEVAQAWTELAAKDLENVEMVAESEFKELLALRMKQLSNETRRLCGLNPLEMDTVEDRIEEREQVEVDLFTCSSVSDPSNVDLWDLNLLKVIEMSQYKKKKGKSKPSAGQIVFNF